MPLTIFQQSHHAAGSAPDTTALLLNFDPPGMVIDVLILDNDVLVQFSSDGQFYGSPRRFVAGTIGSFNLLVRSMYIVNATAGQVARYDITTYYSPIEIVGEPFNPRIKS